jgi:hypothetical protein
MNFLQKTYNFHFRTFSYIYLLISLLLFAYGWLNVSAALLLVAALAAGMYFALSDSHPVSSSAKLTTGQCLLLLAFVALWVSTSGIGGIGFQNSDYEKHNAILLDLIKNPWPVVYPSGDFLIYSFAYYLPAAAWGKAFGWASANYFMFAWAVIGIFLGLQWFIALVGKPAVWVAAIFALLGGLDYLGSYWIKGNIPHFGDHIEWWAGFAQMSSVTTQLYWVPQHGIGGWLLTGLLLYEIWQSKSLGNAGFIIALSLLWSPLVAIGLFIIAGFAGALRVPKCLSKSNLLIAPVIGVMMSVFILGNTYHHPYEFIWRSYPILANMTQYLLFFPLEVGVLAVFAWTGISALSSNQKQWFLFCVASLFILSFLKFGATNDLVMRTSIPLLLTFWILVSKIALALPRQVNFRNCFFAAFILISFMGSISEMQRAYRYFSLKIPDQTTIKSTPAVLLGEQYLGNTASIYARYLAPKADQ